MVRLSEDDELDVSGAQCALDELGERRIDERVVAFGAIAMANAKDGNLWLTWTADQPSRILIPAELVPGSIAQGWEWVWSGSGRPPTGRG